MRGEAFLFLQSVVYLGAIWDSPVWLQHVEESPHGLPLRKEKSLLEKKMSKNHSKAQKNKNRIVYRIVIQRRSNILYTLYYTQTAVDRVGLMYVRRSVYQSPALMSILWVFNKLCCFNCVSSPSQCVSPLLDTTVSSLTTNISKPVVTPESIEY